MRVSAIGEFKSDLRYYDINGELLSSAEDMLINRIIPKNVFVFDELVILQFPVHVINQSLMSRRQVHLKNQRKINKDSLLRDYKLVKLVKGELFGALRTEELSSSDQAWIDQSKLEILFYLSDGGMCDLQFISSAGKYSRKEKAELKAMVQKCVEDKDALKNLLSNLHKSRIIMNGFCSC